MERDPWEDIEDAVNVDSTVKGKVIGFGERCAYINMENGLEGVIYNEDLSWTRRVNRAQDLIRRSHNYEFKVLGLDKANRRIVLGLKQLKENPWPHILERYPVGKIIEADVVKITSFGVFVKLEEDLEGLVFSGEIDKDHMQSLKSGDKLKVKVIKIDPDAVKIGLSAKIDEPHDTPPE